MIRTDNLIDIFTNVIKLVKLYTNNLIKITYNGVNTQSYITDRVTAAGFINMFHQQNKVIHDLLLLDVADS